MMNENPSLPKAATGFLRRLAKDRAGNTLALLAAAILPLLALVGGGVDMSRAYLAASRLQQACDAGVLAARKRLGADAAATGEIGTDVAETGQRFFNINYRDGAYGSINRDFVMTLEEDFAISGVASVDVETTLMGIFGFSEIPIGVSCEAQINFANTDVMMVLDVTGSMALNNPEDTAPRIDVLKDVIKDFHASLNASAKAGSEIRYGFVPYSTNVNVGHLLKDEWVTTEWAYSTRRVLKIGGTTTKSYYTASSPIGGSRAENLHEQYTATDNGDGTYSCPTRPANTGTNSTVLAEETSEPFTGPPAGTRTEKRYERTRDGDFFGVSLDGTTCSVTKTTYKDYIDTYSYVTEPTYDGVGQWLYDWIWTDVSDWRSTSNGCIEERQTYQIKDYGNVDFSKALDLNLDLVPTDNPGAAGVTVVEDLRPSNPDNLLFKKPLDDSAATKWRPMYPARIFGRAKKWDGSGKYSKNQSITSDDYIEPNALQTAACPPPAQKLQTMTTAELDAYLETLVPRGSTYHDIGMIWGGRLTSPDGLFAAENGGSRERNLIFLTDGETSPLDLSYSSYGFEPVDQRRWDEKSKDTLTETVEKRFAVACQEVRKRGITVWVIGFGVELSDTMKDCAGEDRYFEAADAAELNAAFGTIADKVSDLRITD